VDDLLDAVSSPSSGKPKPKPRKVTKVRDWVEDAEDDVDDNILDALVVSKKEKEREREKGRKSTSTSKSKSGKPKPSSSSSGSSRPRPVKREVESEDDLLDAVLPVGPPVGGRKGAPGAGTRQRSADFSSDEERPVRAAAEEHDPVDDLIADAMDED